ncbi:uncharacterized membrane protein YhaH (DUF805 family) [Nicoletella semolina]|uniref:Uncharacterized membrane protein YhaH (DUF805 family) n=1 Tax=Nicoletella semolina TaxID=271160 RepID=A0A4R2NCT9_9PAST|nr:DUF805 domain-containing protein [Nicoletella semolina]MDH2924250.1 hypothetical protein [Nicoletella semolina]TCP18852.1 uncharacterized membrane protein YhaH (DUF805 family) [Nicoletella semolina]
MNWFILGLKRSFDFKGRSRRREFGWFILISFLITLMFRVLSNLIGFFDLPALKGLLVVISFTYSLIFFIATVSVITRRLHDLGYSGWLQAAFLVMYFVLFLATIFALDQEMGGIQIGEYLLYGLFIFFNIAILIIFLVLTFKDGQRFANKYGEDPKAMTATQAQVVVV